MANSCAFTCRERYRSLSLQSRADERVPAQSVSAATTRIGNGIVLGMQATDWRVVLTLTAADSILQDEGGTPVAVVTLGPNRTSPSRNHQDPNFELVRRKH